MQGPGTAWSWLPKAVVDTRSISCVQSQGWLLGSLGATLGVAGVCRDALQGVPGLQFLSEQRFPLAQLQRQRWAGGSAGQSPGQGLWECLWCLCTEWNRGPRGAAVLWDVPSPCPQLKGRGSSASLGAPTALQNHCSRTGGPGVPLPPQQDSMGLTHSGLVWQIPCRVTPQLWQKKNS